MTITTTPQPINETYICGVYIFEAIKYSRFVHNYSDSYQLPDPQARYTKVMGLVGELGEVCEHIKKHLRDGSIDVSALTKELGDLLAYTMLMRPPSDVYLLDSCEGIMNPPIGDEDYTKFYLVLKLSDSINQLAQDSTLLCNWREAVSAIAMVCRYYDITMEHVMVTNRTKLQLRWDAGKQRGSGDNR